MKLLLLLLSFFCLWGCSDIEFHHQEEQSEEIVPIMQNDDVTIHFLATGNSDAMIIEGEKTVVMDGGHQDDAMYIVAYLKALGIQKIDYLINTHPDRDHIGGLDEVINHFDIGTCLISNAKKDSEDYGDFLKALEENQIQPIQPKEASQYEIGKHASMTFYNTNTISTDVNERSLVTLLQVNDKKVLFTGDITAEIERQIKDQIGDIDVLKVAHHGSKYSSTAVFLYVLQPEHAIICTGENAYGHPAQGVLNRLERVGAQIHRSDEVGNIIVTINDNIDIHYSQPTQTMINEDVETTYVGNLNSKKFHYASCDSVNDMKEHNKYFEDDRSKLIDQGFKPCKRCHP